MATNYGGDRAVSCMHMKDGRNASQDRNTRRRSQEPRNRVNGKCTEESELMWLCSPRMLIGPERQITGSVRSDAHQRKGEGRRRPRRFFPLRTFFAGGVRRAKGDCGRPGRAAGEVMEMARMPSDCAPANFAGARIGLLLDGGETGGARARRSPAM
jgi:hypothetical protein